MREKTVEIPVTRLKGSAGSAAELWRMDPSNAKETLMFEPHITSQKDAPLQEAATVNFTTHWSGSTHQNRSELYN